MRWIAYAAGGALAAYGLWGLARNVDPVGWGAWFAGVAVAHDALLLPVLLLVTVVVPWRRARVFLVVAGAVTLVSLPVVLRLGARPDNPTVLPLPYARNLLVVLAVIAVVVFGPALFGRLTRRRGRR